MKRVKSPSIIFVASILLFIMMGCHEEPDPPVACFTYTPSEGILPDEEITFTNCSTDAESYAWDFDDGETSVASDPKHSFSEPGEYNVKLVVQTNNMRDEMVQKITVQSNIVACFTMSKTTAFVNEAITYTNCSTGADSYEWDTDGNGITNYTDKDLYVYYGTAGTYNVKLTAIKGADSKEVVHSITIVESPITACFTMSPNPAFVYETVTFANCSTGADSYEWDLTSDGTVDYTDKDLEGYLSTAGTYNVTLRAIKGSSYDEVTHQLVIKPLDPKVYDMPVNKDEYFFDDFNAAGNWYVGTVSEYSATISSGYYTLTNTVANDSYVFYYPTTMPPSTENYDIEIRYKVMYNNGGYYGLNGMFWGLNSDTSPWQLYYFLFDLNSGMATYNFGNHDGSFSDGWKFLGNANDFNLLTCRKYDNTYYFFLNQVFIKSSAYFGDYGNLLAISTDELSQIKVDKVQINTFNMGKSSQNGNNSTAHFTKTDLSKQSTIGVKPEVDVKKYPSTGIISKPTKSNVHLTFPIPKK